MNKELLNENLNQILEGLKTAIDTANAELPAILEEIVIQEIVVNSVLAIILLVLILLFISKTRLLIKNDQVEYGILVAFVGAAILAIPFIATILNLVFVSVAPKLYIINYIKDLIQ